MGNMASVLKQTVGDHPHVGTSQWLWRRRVTEEEQAVYQSTSCAVEGQGCIPPLQVPLPSFCSTGQAKLPVMTTHTLSTWWIRLDR